MFVWRNIDVPSCNHDYSGKAISITNSECVYLALGIHNAMRTRATLSSVSCAALQYFSTLSHKLLDFRRKKLFYIKCVTIFPNKYVREIYHSKKK
jgi:hypothetical protein